MTNTEKDIVTKAAWYAVEDSDRQWDAGEGDDRPFIVHTSSPIEAAKLAIAEWRKKEGGDWDWGIHMKIARLDLVGFAEAEITRDGQTTIGEFQPCPNDAATITTLRALVESLTEERDEHKTQSDEFRHTAEDAATEAADNLARAAKAEATLVKLEQVLRDTRFRMSLPDVKDLVADEPWLERVSEAIASLTEGEPT